MTRDESERAYCYRFAPRAPSIKLPFNLYGHLLNLARHCLVLKGRGAVCAFLLADRHQFRDEVAHIHNHERLCGFKICNRERCDGASEIIENSSSVSTHIPSESLVFRFGFKLLRQSVSSIHGCIGEACRFQSVVRLLPCILSLLKVSLKENHGKRSDYRGDRSHCLHPCCRVSARSRRIEPIQSGGPSKNRSTDKQQAASEVFHA